jgi:hypothetical protein
VLEPVLTWRLPLVVVLIVSGGGAYGAAVLLLRAITPGELKGMLRRKAG